MISSHGFQATSIRDAMDGISNSSDGCDDLDYSTGACRHPAPKISPNRFDSAPAAVSFTCAAGTGIDSGALRPCTEEVTRARIQFKDGSLD
jgi:hypothetical protein